MSSGWVVMKFGGTSVASAERWLTIGAQVRQHIAEGLRPVVVCSAVSGVTSLLEQVLGAALAGSHASVLAELDAIHVRLARQLGVDATVITAELASVRRLAEGVSLVGEVSPRVRARVLAHGELLSTRLGAAFLMGASQPVAWVDARELLHAQPAPHLPEVRQVLSATCAYEPEPETVRRLEAATGGDPGVAVITQGFIARNDRGDTVLLGRGGSDTSAAYLAAQLQAARCEIWTDVPGMFTANPRDVPAARLLKALDYAEAQEIASTGAKVLHPRALAPVRDARVPLHVRCTPHPELPGTVISHRAPGTAAQVKAISARSGVVLVNMETVGMWQQVGFLADAFAVFKARGLSIDLVSTSETSVTVSLDPSANALDPSTLGALLADLGELCVPTITAGCASVSLVGRRIRAILHRLGDALALFEEHRVHLVSQAASDLNLTVVVDEAQAERLVRELHARLFGGRQAGPVLGPSWVELFGGAPAAPAQRPAPWWVARRQELLDLAAEETPRFVYDVPTLDARVSALRSLQSVDRVFFAMKANHHPGLLRCIAQGGIGFECVSPGELAHVSAVVPDDLSGRLLFTPNFAPPEEYAAGFEAGAFVTVDNLHPLQSWPELFEGREILLRIDPGKGRGHHAHVRTAGSRSKFGIAPDQLDAVAAAVRAANARVVGLHAHAGSGVLEPGGWVEVAGVLAEVARRFPHVRIVDVGGGLGVPEKPDQRPLDLGAVDAALLRFKAAHPGVELWLEPGRFLVAEAGVLLARVTQRKRKGELSYVGVDVGMNTLIRPALYGAYHEIVNLSRLDEGPAEIVDVVGPICETGDTLGHGRRLPPTAEGDVLLIATAGAYGRVMSSTYNLRPAASEVLLR